MTRILPLLLAWGLLCGAGQVRTTLEPSDPSLGSPLRIILDPGEGDVELAGIPPLDAFGLLRPPREQDGDILIDLVPLRPGRQSLPAFSFHRGRSAHLSSSPLAIDVIDDVPAGASPAPLRKWPGQGTEPGGAAAWLIAGAALLALAALLLTPKIAGVPKSPPPPALEELSGEELLGELQRHLETLPDRESARWQDFSRLLTEARFAPYLPPGLPQRLLADFRAIREAS